jgi:hypothetical protein
VELRTELLEELEVVGLVPPLHDPAFDELEDLDAGELEASSSDRGGRGVARRRSGQRIGLCPA